MVDTKLVHRGRAEDVAILGELSDRVFRPQLTPGSGMPREFPRLFHADNAANLYFVSDSEGHPISLVATYPSVLTMNGQEVSAISIGSVATLAEHRGQGYATQILQAVMEDARPHHALMLVSGGRNLYVRLGCVPFGRLRKAHWELDGADGQDLEVREIEDFGRDARQLHDLYRAEPYRYLRTLTEMEAFLGATQAPRYRARPNPTRVFAAEREGRLQGYIVAVPSRQGDHLDVVEWAGDRTALMGLAAHAGRAMNAQTASCYFQPDDFTLAEIFRARGVGLERDQNEGTIRILNVERLVSETRAMVHERTGRVLETRAAEPSGPHRLQWVGAEAGPVALPTQFDPADVSAWFFTEAGLNLPLPDTAGLNFV